MHNLSDLKDPKVLEQLTDDQYKQLLARVYDTSSDDRKQNQLLYYKPVSERSMAFHECTKKVLAAGGGNRSGKTESMLAHLAMCTTGVFPHSLEHLIDVHFRGPINVRLTVESLTTTLIPVIFPKLKWTNWSGNPPHGGPRGHWGWIPKNCLIDGDWNKSYSAKTRTLRVLCRDPRDHNRILGESTWQFMSFDQDPSDFASGEFHICAHDEPPPYPIWHENEARVMSVGGRMLLAMTWPDDPAIPVDWLFDEVYEPARDGHKNIEWLELWTTENKNIDQDAIRAQAEKWSKEINQVRLYGRPIRFSNRIHPEFTENSKTWCFKCKEAIMPIDKPKEYLPYEGALPEKCCPECYATDIRPYKHVRELDIQYGLPIAFVMDPHPRKPNMMIWIAITPSNDWYQIAELEVDGTCLETKDEVDEVEHMFNLNVALRLMDPNMGASRSAASREREVTWQEEFATAGLHMELADDSAVGRQRVNDMLKPDPFTHEPRIFIHPRCKNTIYQFKRFSWADFKKGMDKDQKQLPSEKYSDYPACYRYLANYEPNFNFLKEGGMIAGRGKRTGSYR